MKIIIALLLSICSANCSAMHELCEGQIAVAESMHNIPSMLLKAIAKVESGRFDKVQRQVRPWPWTVQCAGKSHFFESRSQAVHFVESQLRTGTKPGSIDVGCMQINVGAHGHNFSGINHMFDPVKNINYGATHLKNQMKQSSNWLEAAGNYHSVTPVHHHKYRGLVSKAWNKIDPDNSHHIDNIDVFKRTTNKPKIVHIKQTRVLPAVPPSGQFKSMYGGRAITYGQRQPQLRRIKTTEMRWFALKK